jgi:hypothetical protein
MLHFFLLNFEIKKPNKFLLLFIISRSDEGKNTFWSNQFEGMVKNTLFFKKKSTQVEEKKRFSEKLSVNLQKITFALQNNQYSESVAPSEFR